MRNKTTGVNENAAKKKDDHLLLQLLECLDRDEWKELRGFVQSPLAEKAKTERLVELLDLIEKNSKMGKKRGGESFAVRLDMAAGEKLFPKSTNPGVALRQEFLQLKNVVWEFLIWKELQAERFRHLKKPLLLKALARRCPASKVFQNVHENYPAGTPGDSADFQWQQFLCSEAEVEFAYDTNIDLPPLQPMLDAFDRFVAVQKLKNELARLDLQPRSEQPLEHFLFEELEAALREKRWSELQPIASFYKAWQMMTAADGEPFFLELEKMLDDPANALTDDDKQQLLTRLHNFAAKKAQAGFREYAGRLLTLKASQLSLDKKRQAMPFIKLMNAVTNACRQGKLELAQKYREEYLSSVVNERIRQNLGAYLDGLLLFYAGKKNYSDAVERLKKVVTVPPLLFYNASQVIFKIHYEQDLLTVDELKTDLAAIERKASHDADSSKRTRNAYLNFLRFSVRLYEYRDAGKKDPVAFKALEGALDAGSFSDAGWLRQKLEALR